MSTSRIMVAIVAVIAAAGATVAAIRQRDRNKEVMWSIYADLHNLAVAEEAYFHDNNSYGTDVVANGYAPTHGAVVRIVRADATSWEATATHPGTDLVCTSSATTKKGESWQPPVCK